MAKEAFISKRFTPASAALIERINVILEEYRRMGYRLSLRQLYYQLVARALIENTQQSYKRIGELVSNGRQAGLIDWNMIEDRGRDTVSNNHWNDPAQILRACAEQFKIDKWATQPIHIEVMVEKDALSGVLEPVCRELDISITANKGYSSSSTMYAIGKRLSHKISLGKGVCIIYLGDHDPSGIDMTRDVDERIGLYGRTAKVEVVRLALNMDQVEQWNPPENPAKETDSRFADYRAQYGESSWELDAIEPRTLGSLVRTAVLERRDVNLWRESVAIEKAMIGKLEEYATQAEDEDYQPDDSEWQDEDEDSDDDVE